jgi:hypothetical protein
MYTNCRIVGRFTQWSIVESSGPAARTRGMSSAASLPAASAVVHG